MANDGRIKPPLKSTRDEPKKKAAAKPGRWWLKEDERDLALMIGATVDLLQKAQSERQSHYLWYSLLYGNTSLSGWANRGRYRTVATRKRLVSFNVVKSCVDTVTSRMAKSKPKPEFITSGGDYRQQRKAKKLNKFMDGLFSQNAYQGLANMVFRDACVLGTGVIHVFPLEGKVKYERVLCTEILIDEQEARDGNPRQLHWLRPVDRDVLKDLYPEKASEIDRLDDEASPSGVEKVSDNVLVRSSWHLPSGPDAEDGLHVVTVGDVVLYSEPWTKESFPFAFFRWNRRMDDFWGQGLAEDLAGIQLEINDIYEAVQRSFRLAGTFKLFAKKGSQVDVDHFREAFGSVIWYTDTKPEYVLPQIVPPEMYRQLNELIQKAYEQSGVSQMNATSQKPGGDLSGVALRTLNDVQSDRFASVQMAHEQLCLDVTRLSLAAIEDLEESGESVTVRATDRKKMNVIRWKDVRLDSDDYTLRCEAISSLPDSNAGKLQTIQELMRAGLISPATGRRLLDFADLEKFEGQAAASEDALQQAFDMIVEEGKYTPPEPYDDLVTGRTKALECYQLGKVQALEEDKMELLRRWIDAAGALQQQAEEAAVPAVPEAPPVSGLLPQ